MNKEQLTNGVPVRSLLGKPIYALDAGRCLGSVKDVVYDTTDARLLALTTEYPGYFSAHRRVLLFEDIKSIGPDAITVQSNSVLRGGADVRHVLQAVERGHTMDSKTVLMESGEILGSISSTLIDPSTGRAVSYELSKGFTADVRSGKSYVPVEKTERFGPDAVVVKNDTKEFIESQAPGGMAGAYESAAETVSDYGRAMSSATDEQKALFAQGKIAGNDVRDDSGYLIVAEGEMITSVTVGVARQRGELNGLAMSAASGMASSGYEGTRSAMADAGTSAGESWESTRAKATEGWSRFVDYANRSMDNASRRRAIAEQKRFLKGQISDSDVTDDRGQMILKSGEVITPLVLDTLDRIGKLEQVKVKREEPVATVARVEPQLHVVMETQEQHTREHTRPHI